MLSLKQIQQAPSRDKPYKLFDGQGLYVLVNPNGSKLWRIKYRLEGKEQIKSLGAFPEMSAKQAREQLFILKNALNSGSLVKKVKKNVVFTFSDLGKQWLDSRKWAQSTLKNRTALCEKVIYPALGHHTSVNTALVLQLVKQVEKQSGPHAAILVQQTCSAIFRYGLQTLQWPDDPAAALRGLVVTPKTLHKRALDGKALQKLIPQLEQYGGMVGLGLQLLLHTFVRPSELRLAKWSEIQGNEWHLPSERMKNRQAHWVPLSSQAMALLDQLRWYAKDETGYCFPSQQHAGALSVNVFNRALKALGYADFSAHGFRATASTWLNGQGYAADWIERQLAHTPRNRVRASYNHAAYWAERKQMMEDWSQYLANLTHTPNIV
jgi:integrase